MKAHIAKPGVFTNDMHRLFLRAETPKDRKILERLTNEYQLTNAGKDGTDEWQHVAVELKPKEPTG